MVEFHILKKKYNHIGKVNEYNNSGHLHFYLKNINLKLLKMLLIHLGENIFQEELAVQNGLILLFLAFIPLKLLLPEKGAVA